MMALAAFLAVSLLAYAVMRPATGHEDAGDCGSCHLNDPQKKRSRGELIYVKDFSFMCDSCHPGAKALSHPVGMPGMKGAPSVFPLDWKGQMTCVTCHFFHDDENPYYLRVNKIRKELCLMCHDMEFFYGMKDRGEALSGAHLEARAAEPKRFDIVDEVSIACLSCHDGTVSVDMVRTLNSGGGYVSHMKGASHPIGADYEAKAGGDDSYTPVSQLPPEIHLPGGKLGCVSCHAPYREKHGSIVVKGRVTGLCLICHRK